MKRQREWDASKGGFAGPNKKRRAYATTNKSGGTFIKVAPVRTYPNSLVPQASRGYTPNSVEKKVFDVVPATYNVNTTAVFTPLCLPILGSDMTNRIGRKICIKSIQIRGWIVMANAKIQPPVVSEVAAQHARLILLWDTQPNGALPTTAQVLTTANSVAMLNLDNRDRFRVLADKNYYLDPFIFDTATSTSTAVNQIKQVKLFRKLNLETIFNGTNGGTIADIASGSLVAMWIGSDPGGLNGPVDFAGSYRVRFEDA